MPEYVRYPIVAPGIDVEVVLEVYEEENEIICGMRFLTGEIRLGPKAFRRAMTAEIKKIEEQAKASGCHEIRHAGRDLSRFLDGYFPVPELTHGQAKRL